MEFLEQRIKRICEELKNLEIREQVPVFDWEYQEGFFLTPQEAESGTDQWLKFDGKNMHWYGKDRHYWFKTTIKVPQEMDQQELWLFLDTGIDDWDDGKNPQFLVFLDGQIIQGSDRNHREILLCGSARAGDEMQIDLQAYTGTLHDEFRLCPKIMTIDQRIRQLYYDLWVPLSAFPRMEKENPDRMQLEKVLNQAINLLDLRTPYSLEFEESLSMALQFLQTELYQKLAGYSDVVATCIGHTHIDIAWWWTVAQTREKAARSFATVLKLMDEYPNYHFMSSQPVLYQAVRERYPDLYEKIRQRVREGRWEPEGAMWVEADCNLTSGESLVRQILHGKRFFREEFGVESRILWLPDVFGYSGALPQIMKRSGIEYFMTTKLAWNQFNRIPCDTFVWRGIDGSEIFTHMITTLGVGQPKENFFTTYNGMLHPDAIMGGWERYQNKDINQDILISYGYGDGGGGPTREMLETSKRMEKGIKGIPKVRQAFAGTYFKELKERVSGEKNLPLWDGELYFEYHRGTYTSMARNKRSNRKTEIALMDLEFFSVLAGNVLPYPLESLDRFWQMTLLNQFHDILPGSSIKEVYEVTRQEYQELSEQIEEQSLERMLAAAGPGSGITLFNTLGFSRSDLVNLQYCEGKALRDSAGNLYPIQQNEDGAVVYVTELPAKGYRTYEILDQYPDLDSKPFVISDDYRIETPFYLVSFDIHGQIEQLYDKENQRNVFQQKECGNLLRMYEDKPIYYDNWDIDIFYTEKFWDLQSLESFEWIEQGPVRATLKICRKASQSRICQKIHFYASERRIDFETYVDWKEHQTLLKVHFPLAVHTDEATFDIQFGNLTRKTHQNTSWDKARFESCGQKWADLSEGHYGVSLLNDCKYGHSCRDGNLALTLIKSGIEPNPTTDQEEHFFTYSLYPHAETWRQAGTVRKAYCLNQPIRVLMRGKAGMEYSFAQVEPSNVILETIKQSETGDGVILRLYESENALTRTRITVADTFQSAALCNLMEEEEQELMLEEGRLAFEIKPYEIVTILLKY